MLVMLTNIILINSQDKLEATHAPFLWTWITDRTTGMIPDFTERFHGEQSQDQGPLITEEMASIKDQGAVTDVMSSAAWTEENFVTRKLFAVARQPPRGDAQCQLYGFMMLGPVPIIISLFGVIGNSLCIVVFWPDRKKSATTLLLLQLAVIDTLVLVIWSFCLMVYAMIFYMKSPLDTAIKLYPYVKKYGWAIGNMIQMIACWLIVYITVQRYVAVCHPHKMRLVGSTRMAWVQLAVLVTVSILFNIPRLMEVDIVVREDRVGVVDTEIVSNEAYILYYQGIAYYMIQFVIPVTLLVFFTVSLSRQLIKSTMKVKIQPNPHQLSATPGASNTAASAKIAAPGGSKDQASKGQASKDDVILAVIVVDIVFIFCQLLNPIRRIAVNLVPADQQACGTPYYYFSPLTGMGIILNSAVNFLIFCLFGKGFRGKVFQRLCPRKAAVNPVNSVDTKQTNC